YPELVGLADKDAAARVNKDIRALAEVGHAIPEGTCKTPADEERYQFEVTYGTTAPKGPYAGVDFQVYTYAGGAHGMHGVACRAVGGDRRARRPPVLRRERSRRRGARTTVNS